MSPMALLLLLLVLAYIGSLWASSERKRAFGSPSGIEYVALGALLGPEALGVLGQEAIGAFEPIAIVALGWVGLVFGLECGLVGGRRAPPGRLLLGIGFTLLTAAASGYAVYELLGYLQLSPTAPRLLISAAAGLVSAESSRHAMRWLGERQPLSGPLSELLLDLAAGDDAPILVALAFLFAHQSAERTLAGVLVEPAAMAALTLAAGLVLGAVSAWLIRKSSSPVERWTVLLGSAWLVTGLARSLGLSALAATFVLGVTLSAFSRDAPRLRAQVGQTEGAVLLPALLLAGAHLAPPQSEAELALIACAIAVRLLMSLLFGFLVASAQRATRGLGPWLGAGMLASGTLTTIVGFGLTLRFPPEVARPALSIAFVGTLLGELVGPAALKRAFLRASVPPNGPASDPPSGSTP